MNWGRISALIQKDLSLYFRNPFISIITIIGIVFYIAIYFIMPSDVDETLEIGLYSPIEIPGFTQVEAEGLTLISVESEQELQDRVMDSTYTAGILLENISLSDLSSDQFPAITLYMASDLPQYVKDSIEAILKEFAFQAAGHPLPVIINEKIIGNDMAGMQVPPRDRIRPMLAISLIMFEIFGLANLIAEELETGTVRALLITRLSVKELFAGKGLFGIGLAFIQAVLFMAIVGGLSQQPLIILIALLLGSIMATGTGFVIGAVARDFMSVLAWGMIIFIILLIPSFGIMFPGTVSGWIEYIPSYYLVDMVHQVANFNAGWSDVWTHMLILLGFSAVLFWIGILGIRRRTG